MKNEKNLETKKNNESDESFNRRNVDSIKRLIVLAALFMFVLPMMVSLYLMMRLNSLERRMDDLINTLGDTKVSVEKSLTTEWGEIQMALGSELDDYASDNIDKTRVEDSQILANSYSSEEQADVSEETQASVEATEPVMNGKKVYLTFDDGPSSHTGELLDVLKDKNVKATFFVVHNPDESLWDEYRRIVADGHTLGMHSYTHVYSEIYASKEAFIKDVSELHTFLYEQTGVNCRYYRFPGGSSNTVSDVDIQELMEYLYKEDIRYYDWNALSGDAMTANMDPDELNETVMNYVRANEGDSMVLMHDLETSETTIEALGDLIDTLRAEGYEICPIDDYTTPVQHVSYTPDYEE
ncbi:MAG: polysaccharide deacetylase [Clostridium sp.]|nr:polysaccharide deacetylase [Clostridium sp.]MCM1400146.1 polysaccharide deacetylase [Clostridium sp.]MCM1460833.1 polysaccharide deacetylase [Bacteroides sp.]